MLQSCTVSKLLPLDYENNGFVTLTTSPFGGNFLSESLELMRSINLCTKFEVSGFTVSKDKKGDAKRKKVVQLSQRDRATHELLRFAKLRSGIFEPAFRGLRGNVDASCVRRWKKRSRTSYR